MRCSSFESGGEDEEFELEFFVGVDAEDVGEGEERFGVGDVEEREGLVLVEEVGGVVEEGEGVEREGEGELVALLVF